MEETEATRTFFVLRYTIIEEAQIELYSKPLPVPKGKAVVGALGVGAADKNFRKNGVNYSFVGFKWANPNSELDFPSDRFIIGKLAKKRMTETGVHVPGDIVMNHLEDWIGLIAIFDTKTQHIIIEKNWRFGTPEQIETALQAGLLKDIADTYNCKVFVKGRTKKHLFWGLVRESADIFSLELKLLSPNILDANKRARKALEDLKNIFEQDEIDITLRNEGGKLVVPEEPVADYISYISEGEGSWKITSRKHGGRKKTYSSFQNTDTLELPTPEPSTAEQGDIEAEAKEIPNREVLRLVSATHLAIESYSHD
jgi:hypothetical protein